MRVLLETRQMMYEQPDSLRLEFIGDETTLVELIIRLPGGEVYQTSISIDDLCELGLALIRLKTDRMEVSCI